MSIWSGADFAAWGLAMSIAAIAPLLSVNLSNVVTRRLVEARHSLHDATATAIVLAGRRIGWGLTSAAFITLFSAGAWIQGWSSLNALTANKFLILLIILLLTNSWLLLWQVRFGQFFAEERNWIPALIFACARAGGLLGMLSVVALGNRNLIQVALGIFAGTWLTLITTRWALTRLRLVDSCGCIPTNLEIRVQLWCNLRILYGFAFGTASSLIVQYSIPPLIAIIEPQLFSSFYLAGILNSLAIGVLSSAMSALLAPFARWHTTGSTQALNRIGLFSPAVCAGMCLSVLCLCWFTLEFALNLLSPRSVHINDVRLFLALLGLQAIVRTAAAGFATYVSSAGTSRQMAIPLLIEIVLTLTVAVPLGWLFGVHSMLLGLTFAALIGSQFSSIAFAALCKPARITSRVAFASLLSAQLVGAALWWLIVSTIG
ncbi:hypothetical protein [Pusillimonas minor]|uniref:Polysaccharide biosynthesis protein n=1 Tax=Pusillimonas minor TaxID=2697024 RepID=A0A842HM08_9BURK|nr:hypothetical protein [Pusillimonas minor]MBC2769839.1 hypothetical protein [Pusillimonas minor]